MYKIVLIGSDPEFFLSNKEGKIISSTRVIPGSKEEPVDLSGILGDGFSLQKDNVLVEACVPPVKTAEEMYNNIQVFKEYLEDKLFKGEYKLLDKPSNEMDPAELTDPSTLEFGCSSSLNAWTQEENPRPDINSHPNFRSAGGHIHVSYTDANIFTNYELVKWMDIMLGLPSILLDKDTERRKLYGKAGEMRHTNFGCEYRTLSNYWVFNKEITEFLFKQIEKAMSLADVEFLSDEEALEVQLCINTNNVTKAEELCKRFGINVEEINLVLTK